MLSRLDFSTSSFEHPHVEQDDKFLAEKFGKSLGAFSFSSTIGWLYTQRDILTTNQQL
jgi:hypothetical protein